MPIVPILYNSLLFFHILCLFSENFLTMKKSFLLLFVFKFFYRFYSFHCLISIFLFQHFLILLISFDVLVLMVSFGSFLLFLLFFMNHIPCRPINICCFLFLLIYFQMFFQIIDYHELILYLRLLIEALLFYQLLLIFSILFCLCKTYF